MSSSNRQVTVVNHTQLEQMFPGMTPNTQIRISGPLIPSEFFQEVENYTHNSHETIPLSPPTLIRSRIIDPSVSSASSERKSEDIHFLNNHESSARYSVVNQSLNSIPEENKKKPDSEITKIPTRDLAEEEYVQKISKLSRLILGTDVESWEKVCGPNIEVLFSINRDRARSFSVKNMFEVNGIIVGKITVETMLSLKENKEQALPLQPLNHFSGGSEALRSPETDAKPLWAITLTCIKNSKDPIAAGIKYYLQYVDKDLQTVVRKSYNGLRAMRRCMFCMSIWNSELSDVCPLCLFTDYFTRENELYDCPVCKESIRDWTILDCNHRLCYKCLAQIRNPRKCPMCRHDL
jgi:hypothetical protein